MKHMLFAVIGAFLASACAEPQTDNNFRPIDRDPQSVTTVAVRVEYAAAQRVWVESSLDQRARHEMQVGEGNFTYTYTVSTAVEGEQTLKLDNGFTDITDKAIVYIDDVRVCYESDGVIRFTLPVQATDDCYVVYEVPSGTNFDLASLEEAWQSGCNFNPTRRHKWVSIDIEMHSFPWCVDAIKSWKQEMADDAVVACYVNVQEMFYDNPARVWQQANYDWIMANAFDWFLMQRDGTHAVFWPGMHMLKQWTSAYLQWINEQIAVVLTSQDFAGVCDELHYDNFNWVMQWIFNVMDLDLAMTPWRYDELSREGHAFLVRDIQERVPDLTVSVRANKHPYAYLGVGCVLERAFYINQPGDAHGSILQGAFHAKSYRSCVLQHNYDEVLSVNRGLTHDEEVETGYAVSMLLGMHYAYNEEGDQSHYSGGVILDGYAIDLGEPVSGIIEPYARRFMKQGFTTLRDGECLTLQGRVGDIAYTWMQVVDGVFGESVMTGVFDNLDAERADNWWDSGFRYTTLKENNPTVCFDGEGSVELEDVSVFATDTGSGYYARFFENGEVYVNPSATDSIEVTTSTGRTRTLKPRQGIVVGY